MCGVTVTPNPGGAIIEIASRRANTLRVEAELDRVALAQLVGVLEVCTGPSAVPAER
jgi:hypothetical protein